MNCNIRYDVFDEHPTIHGERLLIKTKFSTNNILFRIFFFLGYHKILPVNNLVKMVLTFKNIGTVDIENNYKVEWHIYYPKGSSQFRRWNMNIPKLKQGVSCKTKPKWLFFPDVPGHYTLSIERPQNTVEKKPLNLKYAGKYGLIGRKYLTTDNKFQSSFYVIDRGQYAQITIVTITLLLLLIPALYSLFTSFLCLVLYLLTQLLKSLTVFNFSSETTLLQVSILYFVSNSSFINFFATFTSS